MRKQSDEREWLYREQQLLSKSRQAKWQSGWAQGLSLAAALVLIGVVYGATQINWITLLKTAVRR